MGGKEGLLEMCEMEWKGLERMEERGLKEGDEIEVKVVEMEGKSGKLKV